EAPSHNVIRRRLKWPIPPPRHDVLPDRLQGTLHKVSQCTGRLPYARVVAGTHQVLAEIRGVHERLIAVRLGQIKKIGDQVSLRRVAIEREKQSFSEFLGLFENRLHVLQTQERQRYRVVFTQVAAAEGP